MPRAIVDLPDAQAVHDGVPVTEVYLPMPHTVQALEEVIVEYLPAAQATHEE